MNIVVAVNSDWGIGRGGVQSIVIPEDRRRFKDLTEGGTVITGRATFEGITGSLNYGPSRGGARQGLPNRRNIILTRYAGYMADGCVVVHSIDEALVETADEDPARVFVIGGGSVYRQFLPMCVYAYVTKIEAAPQSDVFFPNLDALPDWTLESCGEAREYKGVAYSFNRYVNHIS